MTRPASLGITAGLAQAEIKPRRQDVSSQADVAPVIKAGTARGFVLILVALLVALGAYATSADATEPVVSDNISSVAEHAARGGAVDVPNVGCGSECSNWWAAERGAANQPGREQLWRELRTVRGRAGVLPKLGVLGEISLAIGAAELGWKVGQGISEKLLHIGRPSATADGTQRLTWYPKDTYFGGFGGFHLPGDCFVWNYVHLGDSWWGAPSPNCQESWPSVPGGMQSYAADPWCGGSHWTYAYVLEDDLPASGAVEDYTTQPFDRETQTWDNQPQTRAQLQDRLQAGLGSGDFPMLDAWLAYHLEPNDYEDPTDNQSHKCDLSTPLDADPAPERGTGTTGSEFLARYDRVPDSEFPTSGLPATGGRVYMHWGWTAPSANPIQRWKGFGYRKIKAKHGWSSADLAATEQALQTTPIPDPDNQEQGRYLYVGSEYSGSGDARCVRFVVVDYELSSTEVTNGAPEPASLITSFGKQIG